jgi:hypothetical protein
MMITISAHSCAMNGAWNHAFTGEQPMIRPVVAAALVGLAAASPASAQFPGGGLSGQGGPVIDPIRPQNRDFVRVSTVPVGQFCVRITQVVGLDRVSNAVLFRVPVSSDVLTGLGVMAYENALASSRNEAQARAALPVAARDAAPYRRDARACS